MLKRVRRRGWTVVSQRRTVTSYVFCGPDGERVGPVETDEEIYAAVKRAIYTSHPDPRHRRMLSRAWDTQEALDARNKEED
jgi:hypothetical protein